MFDKLYNKILKFFTSKTYKQYNGYLIFWISYQPDKPEPNVFMNGLHPDMKQDKELVELCQKLADRIRLHKDKFDELLEDK
jgi:hypothetical protein